MKTNLRIILNVTAVSVLAAGACLLFNNPLISGEPSQSAPPKVIIQNTPLSREVKLATSFAPVVKRVSPSVVTIYTKHDAKPGEMQQFQGLDELFRQFGDPRQNRRNSRPQQQQPQAERGLGSGVIVSEDGYILTNNHVVEDADEIRVTRSDSKDEYIAKVIGKDPSTDIAVIKVDAKGLIPVTMTDSDRLEVGDLVLAVGNPFGIGQTVTSGIVSATGRGSMRIVDYENFIQTDASINPGNSGGALVDAEGRVVGINTAILSRTGGNQGIGFAVPINLVRFVMDRIVVDGKVTRGYLGVLLQPVTPELAKAFNVKGSSGALVAEVQPKTPAAEAGLKEGDLITELNGKAVEDSRQLRLSVSQLAPKTLVSLKVVRDGKEKTVKATLGELPGKTMASNSGGPAKTKKADTLDGVEVADIDARSRRQFDLPETLKGALVTDVDPNSAAGRTEDGLRPGDVILEINRKPVNGADDAVKLSDNSDEKVLLRVWSRGASRFVVIDSNKAKK
ncbi:MAG TPA: DegQ family serine endoprotease [Roseimicrobium sp.]|nr:DegQ family serine endoprotease [Roseimicrobium sp.]